MAVHVVAWEVEVCVTNGTCIWTIVRLLGTGTGTIFSCQFLLLVRASEVRTSSYTKRSEVSAQITCALKTVEH